MMAGIIITGIKATLVQFNGDYMARRRAIKRTAINVEEDLLRKARDRSPVRTGTLIGSGVGRCTDMGYGRGFKIEVGFDTPYAIKMHEAHYQAHDPHDNGRDKRLVTLRLRHKGVKVSQVIAKRTPDGMWIDSKGNKHGRKYLTRAWDDNKARYMAAFEAQGDN